MSIPLIINGVTYNFPAPFDTNWAPAVDAWATAVSNGLLQKAGGSFPLTSEVDFGNSFGLRTLYIKSEESNVASTGILRLASQSVGIAFRNTLNSADLILTTDSSNQLTFNGIPLGPPTALLNNHIYVGNASNQPADVAMSGDVTIINTGATTIANLAVTAAKIANTTITDAQINASAGITLTKLAATTANKALASDSSGFITASTTTDTELGYVSGVTSSIQTQINDIISGSGSFQSGDMKAAGYSAVPTGWLLCDGTSYLRATYPSLFSAIGTTYGSADGTHFNVPNMVNAVPIGAGSIAAIGVTAGADSVTPTDSGHTHHIPHKHTSPSGSDVAGNTGFIGIEATWPEGTTTLTRDIVEMAGSPNGSVSAAFDNTSDTLTANSSSGTADIGAVSVVQPSLGVTWFIKI
jgi:microcystin-dependent protein